jgi:hypothetical protein
LCPNEKLGIELGGLLMSSKNTNGLNSYLFGFVIIITVLSCLTLFNVQFVLAAPPFDDCASDTGFNATVAIPSDVVMMHNEGAFIPVTGDEIAVFRPDGFLCTGLTVFDSTLMTNVLTVWGDDVATQEIDGMLSEEVMLWRVNDVSENRVYDVEVTYNTSEDYHPNGQYGTDRLYELTSFMPTSVTLISIHAQSANSWLSTGLIMLIILTAVTLSGSLYIRATGRS